MHNVKSGKENRYQVMWKPEYGWKQFILESCIHTLYFKKNLEKLFLLVYGQKYLSLKVPHWFYYFPFSLCYNLHILIEWGSFKDSGIE